jgi:hypothetical protein
MFTQVSSRFASAGSRLLVPLCLAVSSCDADAGRTGSDRPTRTSAGRRRAAGPAVRGALDLLAGNQVMARDGVRVDAEQDPHAVPGTRGDLSGRGTRGQPQRQRGMTQVVRPAHPRGTLRPGRGAGLVPDPAVQALTQRPATGTPEQPTVTRAPVRPQMGTEQGDQFRRDRHRTGSTVRAELETARLPGRPVPGPRPRGPRQRPGQCQLTPASRRQVTRTSAQRPRPGAAPRSTGSRRTRSAPGGSG